MSYLTNVVIVLDNDLTTSVLFYRSGKSYYYNFKGKTYEVNAITINKLKESLNVPFKIQFSGLSRAQIRRVIGDLLDSTIDVKIKKINAETNNLLKYEAIFIRQKKYVEVYKVPNVSSLYSRTTNCNPFLYTSINSRKVLIEVPKDYAKENIGNYYFLSCDLELLEKEFFDSQYDKLECDYVYKLEKNLSAKKTNQKRLNKRLK